MVPDVIGACFPEWWKQLREQKLSHEFEVNGLAADASDLGLSADRRHDSRGCAGEHEKVVADVPEVLRGTLVTDAAIKKM